VSGAAFLRRLLLVVAATTLLLMVPTVPASAHPTLLSTTPEAGYSVAEPPEQVVLVFDEPVSVEPRGVRLLDADRDELRISTVAVDQGGRRLTVRLLDRPGAGRYVVRWRVTAQDGDVVDSSFDFAVGGATAGLRGGETTGTVGFPVVVGLRWLLFVALALAVGGLVGGLLADRLVPGATQPSSLIRPAALSGVVAATGLLVQVVAAAGGGRVVPLLGIEAVGMAFVAVRGERGPRWLTGSALIAVIGAESLRSHLGTQHGVLGALLLAVHLAAGCVWIGTLVHVLRLQYANRDRSIPLAPVVAAYARLALTWFALAAAAGTAAALLLVPSPGLVLTTDYGRALVVKLVLVGVVVALALTGRRLLRRRPAAVARPARAEAATLIAVLAASAVVVSLPTPAPVTRDLGYPPPVAGPRIRLGTLAGQIAIAVTASENRLEIRLHVPDDSSQLGESPPPDYRLSARLSSTGQSATTIALQACGPGCYLAPVRWRDGTNHVDTRVEAPGWNGGASLFTIHWPLRPAGPDAIGRVRQAMLAQRSIRVTETVTSDTSRPAPPPQTVTITGREFLEAEPYASPPDPQAITRRQPNGNTLLTFGLPAEGTYLELELDATSRILQETIAAPKHLTRRTFRYT
jgi:copper transport protein